MTSLVAFTSFLDLPCSIKNIWLLSLKFILRQSCLTNRHCELDSKGGILGCCIRKPKNQSATSLLTSITVTGSHLTVMMISFVIHDYFIYHTWISEWVQWVQLACVWYPIPNLLPVLTNVSNLTFLTLVSLSMKQKQWKYLILSPGN